MSGKAAAQKSNSCLVHSTPIAFGSVKRHIECSLIDEAEHGRRISNCRCRNLGNANPNRISRTVGRRSPSTSVVFVISRLQLSEIPSPISGQPLSSQPKPEASTDEKLTGHQSDFASFADLYDAAQPASNSDKALVAGYWLQVCKKTESFDGQSANKELKHLGQGLTNITSAIDGLKAQKPALALQLKKSGKSQQARKVYKITVAGVKTVEGMTNA